MTIDLLDCIRDNSAARTGGFTGAIFLTYSLNLTFFEQILAPALDEAGCSNVLILVDPDGYQQAVEMGINSLRGVGVRYVCAPVLRRSHGIQHGKMLFMAGPDNGRLLVGSGNLTFHGYGHNLELYSYFEYVSSNPSSDISPFIVAWDLLERLFVEGDMPVTARQHFNTIQEKVAWLGNDTPIVDANIWHNYDRSLIEQLKDWRLAHGLAEPSVGIQTISPYYDKHLIALKEIASITSPSSLQVHLDPALTNLDGSKAVQEWQGSVPRLDAFELRSREQKKSRRHVHAKAIVGKEKNISWVLTGSANLSQSALLSSWQSGGNLEVVTFFWSENPAEFDYLLENELIDVRPISLSNVVSTEDEPSERLSSIFPETFIVELNLRGGRIEGRLSLPLPDSKADSFLHLYRNNVDLPIHFIDNRNFEAKMDIVLKENTEFAMLISGNYLTPYRWIDQPEALARYGSRSYQSQIKGKLETLQGAGRLFKELMDFLLERVDTYPEVEKHDPSLSRKKHHQRQDDDSREIPAPGTEAFITDEGLVQSIHWALDYHQYPYDRSLLSLQDLLSLVLLRLTSETRSDPVDGEQNDDEGEDDSQGDQEDEKVDILQRLSDYLIRYCNRYATHLMDQGFLKSTSPELIFQNHYTLSKVLLEFDKKTKDFDVFSQNDMLRCFWNIWAPLVWPEIIGLEGDSTLQIFAKGFSTEQIKLAWQTAGLSDVAMITFTHVLGQPASWQSGLWQPQSVETFMVARGLLDRFKKKLGSSIFVSELPASGSLIGIQTVNDLFSSSSSGLSFFEHSRKVFQHIERYHPPVEEKYFSLIGLYLLEKNNYHDKSKMEKLISEIREQELTKDLEAYQSNPRPILATVITDDDEIYCPKCGAEQAEGAGLSLQRGNLVLCTYAKDVWIYLRPRLPKRII